MRIETLKNPGTYINGLQLRSQAAVAISAAEIYGSATSKQELTDFFSDCAVKAGGSVLPATKAVVASGAAITVPVTGTYVSKITPTIAGGVITGFVLS